ncbi:MAG: hypothetical protein WD872_20630 [Pirellulaceae bacterium]
MSRRVQVNQTRYSPGSTVAIQVATALGVLPPPGVGLRKRGVPVERVVAQRGDAAQRSVVEMSRRCGS